MDKNTAVLIFIVISIPIILCVLYLRWREKKMVKECDEKLLALGI
jgi:hypothetical protein